MFTSVFYQTQGLWIVMKAIPHTKCLRTKITKVTRRQLTPRGTQVNAKQETHRACKSVMCNVPLSLTDPIHKLCVLSS
jgi:hypothetical protein